MTASPDLGAWLRQQREHKSWSRNELARRLIRVALVSGDIAMPAAGDVAANIYRWGTRHRQPLRQVPALLLPHPGHPADRFGNPSWDHGQDVPRVIITISLPEGTDAQLRLTSLDTPPGPGTGT